MSCRVISRFPRFSTDMPRTKGISLANLTLMARVNFSPSLTILRNWPRGLIVSESKIYRAFRVCNRPTGVFLGVNPERITLLQSAISVFKRVRRVLYSALSEAIVLERQSGIVGSANHPFADDFYPRKYTIDVVSVFLSGRSLYSTSLVRLLRGKRYCSASKQRERKTKGFEKREELLKNLLQIGGINVFAYSRCNWTLMGIPDVMRFTSFHLLADRSARLVVTRLGYPR